MTKSLSLLVMGGAVAYAFQDQPWEVARSFLLWLALIFGPLALMGLFARAVANGYGAQVIAALFLFSIGAYQWL